MLGLEANHLQNLHVQRPSITSVLCFAHESMNAGHTSKKGQYLERIAA